MEARQLCYFLVACQQPNHATAAKELGIAPSTLSTSLNLLEEELGIQLFRRTQQGFYPTKEARWLYSQGEVILRTMESAQACLGQSSDQPLHEISIQSSLKFFLGRLSKALSASIGHLQRQHPDVLFTVNFQLGLEAALGKLSGQRGKQGADGADGTRGQVIQIDYLDPDEAQDAAGLDGDGLVPIFEDRWVIITNMPIPGFKSSVEGGSGGSSDKDMPPLSPEDLSKLNLILPELPERLTADALAYCQRHGIATLERGEEDVGSLPRLSQTAESFSFLVPQSALSSRLGQRRLYTYPLAEPLVSHLVAKLETDHPAASELVAEFTRRVGQDEEGHIFRPAITLRQIAYFREVYDSRNISLAAQRMRVAQPALSSQIRKLETSLGTQLFERQRSGLAPTRAGDVFAAYAGLIRDAQERIRRDVVDISVKRQSRLRIGLIPLADDTTPLAGALARSVLAWRQAYPDVTIQLFEGPSDLLQDWIASGIVHLSVLETTGGQGGRLELSRGEEMGLVTNPAHGLLGGLLGDLSAGALEEDAKGADFATLKALRFVLPTTVFGIRRLIDAQLAGKVNLDIELECNSLATTLELVRQAPLATILPRSAIERYVQNGDLLFTPICEPVIMRKLYVGFSNERELTRVERDFITLLRQNLGFSTQLSVKMDGVESAKS
ncbi:MAG: LysR family transcriptional regulator [Cohaesibacter sp.]|jgi:DNA-binding transcriptional LysR family regulator|nr:LysR family transcriptional regulator [Cohaesibacter sp.]